MRRIIFLLLTLLFLFYTSPVAAQESKPKVYRWDASDPRCSNFIRDGKLMTTMDVPEAHILVMLFPSTSAAGDLKNYLIFGVVIINHGERSFTVEPSNISLTVLDKTNRTLATLPLDEVVKKIRKSGSPSFFAGLFRPTRTATATVTDPQGRVSNVIVRVPDTEAEAAQNRAEEERRARQAERGAQTYEFGLKANTVFKGEDVTGVIFFEKKKALSDDGSILSIPLGDFAFEIPFGKARTGK